MPKKTKTMPLFFIKIYEFLNDYNLTPADKIVYGIINNCRGEYCKLTNEQLCFYSNLSLRQINSSLKKLCELNLIDKCLYSKYRKIKLDKILLKQKVKENPNFIKLYSSVLMDFNLTLNDKFIYSVIRGIYLSSKKNRTLIPKDICQKCDCSLSTYYTSMKNLTLLSYINKTETKNLNDNRKKYRSVFILKDLWPKK